VGNLLRLISSGFQARSLICQRHRRLSRQRKAQQGGKVPKSKIRSLPTRS